MDEAKAAAKREAERTEAAEGKRKAACAEREELATKLALLRRKMDLKQERQHASAEVLSSLFPLPHSPFLRLRALLVPER